MAKYKQLELNWQDYDIRTPRHQPYNRPLYRHETQELIQQSVGEGGLELIVEPESKGVNAQ